MPFVEISLTVKMWETNTSSKYVSHRRKLWLHLNIYAYELAEYDGYRRFYESVYEKLTTIIVFLANNEL